ncbi:hypothetical protein C8R45DRAFT_962978 [Mycena sanguinolenta]|jgi:hypothetical protein|nr:hypothetical protein C8R45DRAFT_962978 [Mycena sanguinolenta]
MMSSFLLLATLAAGAAAQLTINTPTEGGTTAGAAECQPLLLTFSGGTPPYIITIDTSPQGASHIAEFDNVSGTQLSWPAVNASLGTQLLLSIKDSTGAPATSGVFPVTTGSDSCLTGGGSTGSTTGGSTGSSTGATTGASTTGGSSNTGSANPSSTKPASSSGSGSSTGKPSTSAGAATAVHAPAGVVPAFAAVVLAGLVALLA